MKKTLVALAALATVGAAFAQSSVTLFGKVDVAVANQTQKLGGLRTATGNGGVQVGGTGVSLQNSRWGMRGTEDLGGGMSAIFHLESGFDPDLGASRQGGLLFGRQIWAGLKGGWGEITGGRQYGIIDQAWYNYDPMYGNNVSALAYAWSGGPSSGIIGLAAPAAAGGAISNTAAAGVTPSQGAHNDPARYNNTLRYATPNMGGFTAQLMWAPGEAKNPISNASGGQYYGGLIDYTNGPIGVTLGYDSTKGVAVPPATIGKSTDWTVGGSYDFGVAKLYGGYERGKSTGSLVAANYPNSLGTAVNATRPNGTDKGWQIGAAIPVSTMTLNVAWATERQSAPGLVRGKVDAFSALLKYPLSKRTFVYTAFLNGKDRPSAATAAAQTAGTVKNQTFAVGAQTNF